VLNIFVHWSKEKEERKGEGGRREEEKGRRIRKEEQNKERKKSIVIQLILNVFQFFYSAMCETWKIYPSYKFLCMCARS